MIAPILFDITRMAWRARRDSPTGIDRVLIAYSRWLQSRPEIEFTPVAQVGWRLVPISRARFERLLDQCGAGPPAADFDLLLNALGRPRDAAVVRRPVTSNGAKDWIPLGWDFLRRCTGLWRAEPAGAIYLNVTHSGLEQTRLMQGLAQTGVRSAVMVHDLIPITHSEYCAPAAKARHARRIDHVLRDASLVLANSQTTADDLVRYARTNGRPPPPVRVAPLGLEEAFQSLRPEPARHPYFVCVGTIEARKNLAFLLSLWRRLSEEMGETAPQLVLVGRRGWENEAVIDQLDRSAAATMLVHEIADLSDHQLAKLLGGARALLAPSLAEGYDLPPLEAMAAGVSVIASDIPVHREWAQGALLIDPLDGPGWINAIRKACQTPPASPPPVSRRWDTHFDIVEAELAALGR